MGVMLHLGRDAPPDIDGPVIFDITLGVHRAATQADVDALLDIQAKYVRLIRLGVDTARTRDAY